MKILWISPWFGNYRVPVYEELNRLSEGNFYLICSKENTRELVREKLINTLGDNVIIMEGERASTYGNLSSDFANSGLVIKKQPGLYKKIKEVNADIIITEGFGGWAPAGIRYAVTHRKKLCMFYERTEYVERNAPKWRVLYRRLVGMPVDYFLVNGQLTEYYLHNVLKFRNKPIMKGCMCADSYGLAKAVKGFTQREKGELKASLHLNDGKTFLFVGQMVERKGIRQLLSAWSKYTKKYPSDNLIVIGSGILLSELQEKYKAVGSVKILGGINYDDIYKYYALCDVFIMPTLEDNWCLVVPEAMACGKPIACSIYNGGHYELINDGVDGYCFDPLGEDSILCVLEKFQTADLERMGQNAREIEGNFTPDKAASRIFEACKKIFEK